MKNLVFFLIVGICIFLTTSCTDENDILTPEEAIESAEPKQAQRKVRVESTTLEEMNAILVANGLPEYKPAKNFRFKSCSQYSQVAAFGDINGDDVVSTMDIVVSGKYRQNISPYCCYDDNNNNIIDSGEMLDIGGTEYWLVNDFSKLNFPSTFLTVEDENFLREALLSGCL